MPNKWSAEAVVSAIKELHEQGESLDSTSVRKRRALVWAAVKYHGSWRKAVEAAGIDYASISRINPNRHVWSKEIIVQMIQNLQKQGLPVNSSYVQEEQPLLYGAACKYFGGWPQAIEATGLSYDEIRLVTFRSWSKEAVADAVIDRVKNGLSISGAVVTVDDRSLYRAANRYFGRRGWAKARMLAGFPPTDPDPRIIWDKQSVREEILRLHEEGVSLNCGALSVSGNRTVYSAGRKVFGSWPKAIAAAGLDYSEIRKNHAPWTKEEVIIGIKSLAKQGVRLSSKATQQSHGDLFGAAVTRFGCWSEAVEAAGISYRMHSRTWSTKAWLRRMHPEQYQQLLRDSHRHAQTRRKVT